MRPEDSGVYICQAENNEGVTEIKVQIVVEVGPGAPVATVSTKEMTVVEGHIVTMECQARGKMSVCLNILPFYPHFSFFTWSSRSLLPPRFPSSGHHLVQASGAAAVETHSGRWGFDPDQRGAAGLGTIHL